MFFAVPFFTNAVFLRETLLSVLRQSDPRWSLLVLDDSIDEAESRAAKSCVEQFADPRIQYQKNPKNLGMAANWNQAMDLSSGHELLVILHADDRLKPDYVEEIKQFAQLCPKAAGFFCKTEIIGSDGESVFSMSDFYKKFLVPRKKEIILSGVSGVSSLISGNFIFCPTLCYRMSVIGAERFRSDLKMVLDFEFILRILGKGETWIGYYDHPLFQYRRHTSNTTVALTQNLSRFEEEITLYRELSTQLKERNEIVLAHQAEQMSVVKLNLMFQVVMSFLKGKISTGVQTLKRFFSLSFTTPISGGPVWIAALFFLIYWGVTRLIGLHCFSYYDLGIYSEALSRIHWGDLNPFIPGRSIRIFNDHFDPILIPASFLTHFIPAPYLGVTIESILIALCWFPIRRLRDRGFLNPSKALFFYALIILNQAIIGAVTWPFHPTTWGILPLVCFFSFYLLEDWKLLWVSYFVLSMCREEFPLIGFTLSLLLLVDRKYKQAILFLLTASFWSVFLFVFRPKWSGTVSTYGQDLLGSFIAHPFANLSALLKIDSIRNWAERLAAFCLVLSFPEVRKHWRSSLKILIIAAPMIGIRYAANKWGAHYGPAALISIAFALVLAYGASRVATWRTRLSWILLVVFLLSPAVKNLWDGYTSGNHHFAYKSCPAVPGRLSSIDQAQAWVASSPAQRILLENNLAPTLLLKTAQKDLFILAGPQNTPGAVYDAVLVEKPPFGDSWGIGPSRTQELISLWRASPGVKVIQDDEFVFLAQGSIQQER